MMPIDQTTPNRGYPLPNAENTLVHDVERLRQAYDKVDADVRDLLLAMSLKAALAHVHAIADIVGLQGALDGKLGVGAAFSLNDLTDVNVEVSENGQALIKSGGSWIPAALAWSIITGKPNTLSGYGITDAAAATHNHDDRYFTESEVTTALNGKSPVGHGHAIGDVTGLTTALNDKAPATAVASGKNAYGARTVSTSAPSGGSDGDIWYQV